LSFGRREEEGEVVSSGFMEDGGEIDLGFCGFEEEEEGGV